MSGVGGFITTAQALVPDAIAIAIARELINDVGDLGGQFVGVDLIVTLEGRSPKFFLGKDGRQILGLGGRGLVERRYRVAITLGK